MGGGVDMHAGGMGLGGLLALLIVLALTIVPFWRLLPRAGLPNWLSLFAVFPIFALGLLWLMAFKRWPGDAEKNA